MGMDGVNLGKEGKGTSGTVDCSDGFLNIIGSDDNEKLCGGHVDEKFLLCSEPSSAYIKSSMLIPTSCAVGDDDDKPTTNKLNANNESTCSIHQPGELNLGENLGLLSDFSAG